MLMMNSNCKSMLMNISNVLDVISCKVAIINIVIHCLHISSSPTLLPIVVDLSRIVWHEKILMVVESIELL